jgi:hypothetical protein
VRRQMSYEGGFQVQSTAVNTHQLFSCTGSYEQASRWLLQLLAGRCVPDHSRAIV